MKIIEYSLIKTLMILAFALGIVSMPVFAEESRPVPQASNQGWSQRPDRQQRIEALKKLKAENPEEFARVVKERKEKLKARLQDLKQKDPEKFKEVTRKMRERRKERLQKLRQENPEKFREIMRKKAEKLEDLKEKNPEKYQQFMKNHPRLAERMEHRGEHREDHSDPRRKGFGGQGHDQDGPQGGRG